MVSEFASMHSLQCKIDTLGPPPMVSVGPGYELGYLNIMKVSYLQIPLYTSRHDIVGIHSTQATHPCPAHAHTHKHTPTTLHTLHSTIFYTLYTTLHTCTHTHTKPLYYVHPNVHVVETDIIDVIYGEDFPMYRVRRS